MNRAIFLAVLSATALAASPASAETILALCLNSLSLVTPQTLWSSWSFAPATLIGLAGLAGLYAAEREHYPDSRRPALFAAGWLLVAVALVSPLCRLSANLAWMHMVQHMLLITAAPLLLVAGGLRAGLRGREALLPAVTAFHGITIWAWHVPAIYEAVLLDPVLHVAAYVALIAGAVAFWAMVLDLRHARPLASLGAVFVTMLHMGLLAALLTFAPQPFYPIMAPGALAWGLTPLDDQQLAGLVMWVPGGIFYVVTGVTIILDAVGLGREADA